MVYINSFQDSDRQIKLFKMVRREREIEIEMLLGNELIPKCLMHKPQAPFVVISSLVKVAFIMFKARLSLAEENMH